MIHESSSKGVVTTTLGSYWKNLYTTSRRVSGGTSTTKSSSSASKSDSISSYQGTTGKISSSISGKYSVKTVQTYLKQSGYSVAIDGSYGKSTTQAVKNFQKANGLKVDGIVGPSTIAALKKVAAAKSASKKTTTTDRWAVGSGYYG
jgi:peptidoglycan hydrolase-like protein with peptidoglycan-binding domain